MDTEDRVPTFASRWCREALVFSASEGTEAYLVHLEEVLRSTDRPVVITSHDGTIALLRRHRARLDALAQVALAPEPALAIAVSKERTLAVARQLGIPIPRAVTIRGDADVSTALREIGLPAVLKPDESWVSSGRGTTGTWMGPRLATTADEARYVAAAMTGGGGTALFQQFLTGRREAVSFLLSKGVVHARFAQWARRTRPPLGGESIIRQSIAIPDDIGGFAESLVQAIGLDGYSEVEFRRDALGVPYLMEINPRLSASVEVAVRSGVDFPYLLYQWASGAALPKAAGYAQGRWMRHLGGDIMTTIETIGERGRPGVTSPFRALLDFGASFFTPMSYDYADHRDPRPALRASANFTRYALDRIVTRVRKSFA
ncbi:MAG TPA: ATP-grasp domain-containing protein [Gemmatimonadales bacterium]|nr:ATP-grasp domain-containing protein [Gemmatimonadales bacterium]